MGTQNIKAGAEQLEQDIAADQAAKQEGSIGEQSQPTGADSTQSEGSAGGDGAAPGSTEGSAGTNQAPGSGNAAASNQEPPAQPAPPTPSLVVKPVTLTAASAATKKAVVVEAAVPVAANASVLDELKTILKDVPGAYQIDVSRILAYIDRMTPLRPIDPKAGINEQVALYRSIQNIINRQDEYFTQLFSAVLFLFATYGKKKEVLSDYCRLRFIENVPLHAGDRKGFIAITGMLHIVADPKSRAVALTQITMSRALENGLTAEGRKRVLNYFGL